MKATVVAHANIALVKYWGKRDDQRRLPLTSSIGVTFEGLSTTTSVVFLEAPGDDRVTLDGEALAAGSRARQRVVAHLDRLRRWLARREAVTVVTRNSFPTGAGLASSASGLMALTYAVALAAERVDAQAMSREQWQELSKWARLGSGSACRCAFGGFVRWEAGELESGEDSVAVPLFGVEHWPELRMVVAIVDARPKAVSSTEGMARSQATSPLFAIWPQIVAADLESATTAIAARDFAALGTIAERNAMAMHATTFTAVPAYSYWTPVSLAAMQAVWRLRADGVAAYLTMDAGPQVKVLCEGDAVARAVAQSLLCVPGVADVRTFRAGTGPRSVDAHLF